MAASLFRWINFGPEIDEIDLQAFGEWQEEGVDPFVIQGLSGSDTAFSVVPRKDFSLRLRAYDRIYRNSSGTVTP